MKLWNRSKIPHDSEKLAGTSTLNTWFQVLITTNNDKWDNRLVDEVIHFSVLIDQIKTIYMKFECQSIGRGVMQSVY